MKLGFLLAALPLYGCYERFDFERSAAGSSGSAGAGGVAAGSSSGAGGLGAAGAGSEAGGRAGGGGAGAGAGAPDCGAIGGQAGAPTVGQAGSGDVPTSCAGDQDCPLASLHCDLQSGACFECVADEDCLAIGLRRCDVALHRCVECGLDQDCATGYACDQVTRHCALRCENDDLCPEEAHECEADRGLCIGCEPDDDEGCLTFSRPYCALPGYRCSECLEDADCAASLRCDALSGSCVECRDSRDCPATSACDPANHTCVAL